MDEFLFTIKELQADMFKSDSLNQLLHSLDVNPKAAFSLNRKLKPGRKTTPC